MADEFLIGEHYEQSFRAHRVWEALQNLTDLLNLDSIRSSDAPESTYRAVARASDVLMWLRSILDSSNPVHVAFSDLDALADVLTNASGNVTQILSGNDNSSQLDQSTDDFLIRGSRLLAMAGTTSVPIDNAELVAIRERAEAFLGKLTDEITVVSSKIDDLNTVVIGSSDTAAAVQESFSTKSNALERDVAETQRLVASTKDENALVVAEFRQTFERIRNEWAEQANAQESERLLGLENETQKQIEKTQSALQKALGQGEELLAEIEVLHDTVKKVSGALGNDALAGGFGTYANEQRTSANWLLGGAITSLGLAALVAIILAVAAAHGNETWQRFGSKALVTVALAGLGSYLAVQSAEHRSQEKFARRRHLDLLALGPFIVELDATKQELIRETLALKSFMVEDQPIANSPTRLHKGLSVSDLIKLIQELAIFKRPN
jgi:hypothetical protein